MASRFCTYCGTANPVTAAFCMSCGAPMQGPPAGAPNPAPLPSSVAAPSVGSGPSLPPPPPTYGYFPPPAPPPKRLRWGVVIAVVIVAFLLIGGLVFFLLPSGTVQVTGINFQSPDNACGYDGATDVGFNISLGGSESFTYGITGNSTNQTSNATTACSILSVSTPTPGFSISNANVPLAVPANTTQNLTYTVNCPDSNFQGGLTIWLT